MTPVSAGFKCHSRLKSIPLLYYTSVFQISTRAAASCASVTLIVSQRSYVPVRWKHQNVGTVWKRRKRSTHHHHHLKCQRFFFPNGHRSLSCLSLHRCSSALHHSAVRCRSVCQGSVQRDWTDCMCKCFKGNHLCEAADYTALWCRCRYNPFFYNTFENVYLWLNTLNTELQYWYSYFDLAVNLGWQQTDGQSSPPLGGHQTHMCVYMWSRDQCKTTVKLKPRQLVWNQPITPTSQPPLLVQLSPSCSRSGHGSRPHM